MFLYEKDMRDLFWEKYRLRDNILSYDFEMGRIGGVDLLTFEKLNGVFEINSFEFKLNDIKKAILQAKYNLLFSNKSWIVLPEEKEDLISTKYKREIKRIKGLGVITVKEDGYYSIFIKNYKKQDEKLSINQDIIRLISLSKQ